MSYDEICYKRSCLSQVIIRLDFIGMETLFESDVEKSVLKSFPKKGMQQLIRFQTMNVISDPRGTRAEQTTRDGIQQEFANADGNKIILSNKFFIVEVNKYTKFEDIVAVFAPVLRALISKTQVTSMRTGIRYVNFFSEESIKPQKNFFVPNVGSLLDAKQMENNCIRSMAMNEYMIDDMRLNFRFGMYNPQYPQTMKKSNFVLDYDCFCDDAIVGFDEMMSHIQKGHDSIQKMFETSITSQLREVMSNG